jgi:hypothetical protein
VSSPAGAQKTVKTSTPSADHSAGVIVALATVVVLAILAWVSLPTLLVLTQGNPRTPGPVPVMAEVHPGVPAAAKAARRPPAAASQAAPQRKTTPAKLRAVRYARLRVQSVPWAVLHVDGIQIGRTPLVNYQLPLGRHELRLSRSGYRSQSEKIEVKSTAPITRAYKLHPLKR